MFNFSGKTSFYTRNHSDTLLPTGACENGRIGLPGVFVHFFCAFWASCRRYTVLYIDNTTGVINVPHKQLHRLRRFTPVTPVYTGYTGLHHFTPVTPVNNGYTGYTGLHRLHRFAPVTPVYTGYTAYTGLVIGWLRLAGWLGSTRLRLVPRWGALQKEGSGRGPAQKRAVSAEEYYGKKSGIRSRVVSKEEILYGKKELKKRRLL